MPQRRAGRPRVPSRRLLLLWSAALLVCGCQAPAEPLTSFELALSASDLSSIASEAALLAEQLGDRDVTENYGWVHQQALGDASLELAGKLSRPAMPAVAQQHERLLVLHARLDAALQRIGFAAGDRAALEELHSRFTQIKAVAASMKGTQ